MKSLRRKLLILFVGLSVWSPMSRAVACSVCGCGDPQASAGTSQPAAGSWRLTFENIYLTASAQSDNGTGSTEAVRQVNLNTTLAYCPTDRLTVTVLFPLVVKYWTYTSSPLDLSLGGANDEGTAFGLGDLMVGARYFILSGSDLEARRDQGLALSAGAYLPTGGTRLTSLITGDFLDTHSQLGTGAVGAYGGLLYDLRVKRFTLSAQFNVITRTKALTNDTTSPVYDYKFGTSFTGGLQGRWNLAGGFAILGAMEGRYAKADRELSEDGSSIVDTPNTGGAVIDLTPGLWWNVGGSTALYAKVQIPPITDLIGVQTVGPTYTFGTQILLN